MSRSTIQVRILFFATLKERAGVSEVFLDLPRKAKVSDLKHTLGERFPALQEALPSALISVNREFAFNQDAIPEGAEIAVFPPVSGGGMTAGLPPTSRNNY